MSKYRERFSGNLVKYMELFKMSVSKLAEELGVSEITIYQYRNGNRFPDIDNLCRLAYFFNTTLDNLVGREPKQSIGTWLAAEQYDAVQSVLNDIRKEKKDLQNLTLEIDTKISLLERKVMKIKPPMEDAETKKSPSDSARGSDIILNE